MCLPSRGTRGARRKRTLLSFQRPRRRCGRAKKRPPTLARGPSNRIRILSGSVSKALRRRGTFSATRGGSRRSIATFVPVSRRTETACSSRLQPHEAAPAGLHERAVQPAALDVELVDDLAVQPHRTLRDQTPRLAPRREAQRRREDVRQMDGVARRKGRYGNVLGRLAFPHHTREVRLCPLRRLGAVRAADDEACEPELRVHRLAGKLAVVRPMTRR